MQYCRSCRTMLPQGVLVCPRDGQPTESILSVIDEDPLIGRSVGSYRVLEKIADGGMGSIYLAEHPQLPRKVAVKFLKAEFAPDAEAMERFSAEARLISQIRHRHIIDVLDSGALEDEALPYFIMEYLEGESLRDRLDREKSLRLEVAVAIALQLLDALAATHQRGIIHRDLKPENIMLVPRGDGESLVKLLDFGVAKLLDPSGQ